MSNSFVRIKETHDHKPNRIHTVDNNSWITQEPIDTGSRTRNYSFQKWILNILKWYYLPKGYPNTVSKDYLVFQILLSVQNFAGIISESIAEEAIMKSLGVGDKAASAVAATSVVLVRRIIGRISVMFYTFMLGSSLYQNHKKYKFLGDLALCTAKLLSMLSPLFPSNLRVMTMFLSSFFYSFVGLAGACTRIEFIQHQAETNNTGDCVVKDKSQEMTVGLASTLVAIPILYLLNDQTLISWICFLTFVALHLSANYFALKNLQLKSFNVARLSICLKYYLRNKVIPSVRVVNQEEPILFKTAVSDKCRFQVQLGTSIENAMLLTDKDFEAISTAFRIYCGKLFVIIPNRRKRIVFVILHKNAKPTDRIEAYCRCVLAAFHSNQKAEFLDPLSKQITNDWIEILNQMEHEGFDTKIQAYLESSDWRSEWKVTNAFGEAAADEDES